jgi:D-alanyl-D-alanine carboxypeptidase
MDITSPSVNTLATSFGSTPEGIWVAKNAAEFGFIIRYQRGKEHITGYDYEPWHLRYVGVEAARAISKSNITFEEYLGESG